MGQRLIISNNRDDPGDPQVLDGEAIDAAVQEPLTIVEVMVDTVWAAGTDSTGGGMPSRRAVKTS